MNKADYEYKAGYACGFWADELIEAKRRGYSSFHYNPDTLRGDPKFEMGRADGIGDRELVDVENDDSFFFAFDQSGFPWGSHIEQEFKRRGYEFEYLDIYGKVIKERPAPIKSLLQSYRLVKPKQV